MQASRRQKVSAILTRPLIRHPAARWIILTLVAVIAVQKFSTRATALNGFELSNLQIPAAAIEHGGPPRDGIPSLTNPRVVDASQSGDLQADDRVIGVAFNDLARAYPIRILNYHEIVNDTLGETEFLVTYCPLCGTGIVFDAQINGQRLEFGVSGLLYQSDVLMYDRQTKSLWSQLAFKGISGPLSGVELSVLPATHTSWRDWQEQHPDTSVLSFETGYHRDYQSNPYPGYADSPLLYFSTGNPDDRYPIKSWVAGIIIDGQARAYPYRELRKLDGKWQADRLGQHSLQVRFLSEQQRIDVRDDAGNPVPTIPAFWFAWIAFHPDSSIFIAPN